MNNRQSCFEKEIQNYHHIFSFSETLFSPEFHEYQAISVYKMFEIKRGNARRNKEVMRIPQKKHYKR